ncbi:phospholipase D family protein [Actimicrobium sp. CCI2.3]|uniref:phospholipase D family protein n=1 Tax=Actimicrobium sp. CCI2.3 TaxID=3048616 RepID=UPI002AB4E36C|nr:phospholipase D family protein [Actimicrobium sp. CCI2.3]MDY7573170.1 phospholipase D family protein [Actimicrobium sp. CCI2.3]MEB0022149.1 phospholipase D family protein [Actimicrobium sp. CCI2.3]
MKNFLLLITFTLIQCGCATLPEQVRRPASVALTTPQDTRLGRVVRDSMPAGAQSGFRLLPSGNFAFDTRIALARRAERTLDVQYYLFHGDESGRAIGRELLAAALRGVRVRILLDDIATQGQDELLARLSTHPNFEVRVFNPFAGGRSSIFTRVVASLGDLDRVNHRMHNKLFVADNAMAITGGRNIGNEYFMQSTTSNFIDLDVFAVGAVVAPLSAVFDEFWNSNYAYPASAFATFRLEEDAAPTARPVAVLPVSAELRDPLGHAALATEIDAGKLKLVWANARVVADSPDKVAGLTERGVDKTAGGRILRLMESAQSDVTVISPYFVPGEVGMAAMQQLAARGVRMLVLTNSLAANDSALVHLGYAPYRRPMVELGVHLYELRATKKRKRPGLFGSSNASLHAKLVVVDQRRVFIGSLNLDARSMRTNTEMGLLIDSPELAEELDGLLRADHDESVYRLRLSARTGALEWVATEEGVEVIYTSEPDVSGLFKFGLWLLSPLAPEELL